MVKGDDKTTPVVDDAAAADSGLAAEKTDKPTEAEASVKPETRTEDDMVFDKDAGFSVVVAKRRSRKKLVIISVVVVALLAAGIIGWVLWRSPDSKPGAAIVATEKYQKARGDADKLRGTQDYDGAKQVWQEYIDGKYSDEEKYKAYLQLASLDETKGDCKAALQNYYAAEKIGKGEWRAENEAIGRCSEKLADFPTAIKYYQRTLDTFPGGEAYNSDLNYYKNKIEKLKKAQEASKNE